MRSRNSFWALLGQRGTEPAEDVVERVRRSIQVVLRDQLGEDGFELKVRVCFARDIECLWYLRPEIMNAIATSRGEIAARSALKGLTTLFKGHHPAAASSRYGAR